MFQKKKKCGACGYRFTPQKEEIYTAEEPRSITECLTKPPTRFSVIDCPRCGCQVALAIRTPRVDFPAIAERNDAGEEETIEKWVIDECDSTDETPSFAYIEFHCPKCNAGFGLEQGQYGWSAGEEIPFKHCPMCGERLNTYESEGGEE